MVPAGNGVESLMKIGESITTSLLLLPKGESHDAGTILVELGSFCLDSVCAVFQSLENVIISLPVPESYTLSWNH